MKKVIAQKTLSVILSLLMLFSMIIVSPSALYATEKSNYIGIMHKISTAKPMTPIRYNFDLEKASDIYFDLCTNEKTTVTMTILNREDENTLQTITLPSTDPRWTYISAKGIYEYTYTTNISAGEYILEMNFEAEVNYDLNVSQIPDKAKLNYSKLALTKGFSKQLKVTGGSIKNCSSSNKKVATVSKKGKITAKKIGNAKITVKLTNGKLLTCKVTVKANTYSSKKLTISDIGYNTSALKIYKVSFDSDENMIINFTVANNNYGKLTKIRNFSINIKDSNEKVIASYKKNSYSIDVNSYSSKNYKIVIPKSDLSKSASKIDLRNCSFSISCDSAYSTF